MHMYSGKQAVITGGTIGIGLATAKTLLDAGADDLPKGRNERNLEAARNHLGPRAHAVRSDTSSLADIDALAALVEKTFGEIDFVFINAGVASLEPIEQVTEDSFDWIFNINT